MKIDLKLTPLFKTYDGAYLCCSRCGDTEGEWEEAVEDWSKCAECGHSFIYPIPRIFKNLYRV